MHGVVPSAEADSVATAVEANYGEIFTRRWVADTILDLVGYRTTTNLADSVIVEPSCGTGAFLGPIIERLIDSAHGEVSFEALAGCIQAFDLLDHHVQTSRELAVIQLIERGCDPDLAAELAQGWVRTADFLLDDGELSVDFAVGNPPYIRIEDLEPNTARTYRERWSTMGGRADIYVPFIERCLRSLRPGGRLGFICADRWFRNSYGSALRKLVAENYAVEHVWTMHDVDAFASEVSAYPAITVIANTAQGDATVLDTTEAFGAESAALAVDWSDSGQNTTAGEGFEAHRLSQWFSGDGFWPSGSPARIALVEYLNANFPPLQDETTRTKIGIGVATGADKVYCIHDPTLIEPERALPMVAGRDLNSGRFEWSGEYLANVWLPDGSLVELKDWPKLARHLEERGEQLRARHTAKKNPKNWYRTIDKVNHALLEQPLLMMRDLGASANPVLVPAGYYPHHNVYWVSSQRWDLEVLGGLLLSRVSQAFIEAYCVRMRGGTLRFQAQYLRQIRVPNPDSLTTEQEQSLRAAFIKRDSDLATSIACEAFAIDPEAFEL